MNRTRTTPIVLIISLLAMLTLPALAQQADSQPLGITQPSPARNIEEYLLEKKKDNLAIKGYDPVAYFKDGGGEPTKGDKDITTTYEEVTYRFASEKHKSLFLADPAKYEPAFGGWCAWAMSSGDKTEIDPKTFIIQDGRLFLFYNGFWGNTKDDWQKGDKVELARQADAHWKTISGESPRIPPTLRDQP